VLVCPSPKGSPLASIRGSTLKPEGKEPTLRLQCPVYTSQSHCACTNLALQGESGLGAHMPPPLLRLWRLWWWSATVAEIFQSQTKPSLRFVTSTTHSMCMSIKNAILVKMCCGQLQLNICIVLSVLAWSVHCSCPVADTMARCSTHEDRQQRNFGC